MIEMRLEMTPPDPRFGIWLWVMDKQHRILGMDTSFDGTPIEIEDYWIRATSNLGIRFYKDEATQAALSDIRDEDPKWSNYVQWWQKQNPELFDQIRKAHDKP